MSALATRKSQPADSQSRDSLSASILREGDLAFDLLVVFRLVGQCFGLLASNVREIIHIRNTTRIPNAAAHVEGVVNLRGRIVPVFNLQCKLNLQAQSHQIAPGEAQSTAKSEGLELLDPADNDQRRTVMVVEEEGGLCGLLVEEVTDVVKITGESLNTAASKVERQGSGFVLGTVTLDGERLVTLLSLEALLAD